MNDTAPSVEAQRLFLDALAVAVEERSAWLERRCAGNAGLRREVEALLRADEEAERDGFLSAAAVRIRVGVEAREPERCWTGQRVGAYRVGRLLGRGGMGDVYSGDRVDGAYERRVAIKILRGTLAPARMRLFAAERNALARLEHTAIASLYDGGTTESGVPYLVMERVDGASVEAWCDRRRSGVSERVHLVCRVADAVAYAHRNLVIHRDLKSENVLVTPEGEVKLVDFGIASLLEAEGTPSEHEEPSPRTPASAAPEQIRGDPASTAIDIYGLGALTYRLLTGRSVHGSEHGSRRAVEQAILHDEVRPLAQAAATGDVSATAGRRSTTRRRLRRRLNGDLDVVVRKALSRAPSDRYESARAFAQDLRRAVTGHCVHARRARLSERFARLVFRHRLASVLTSAVALTAFAGVMALSALTARSLEERDVAQLERLQAREAGDLLVRSLLAAAAESEEAEVTVGRALSRALENVEVGRLDPRLEAAQLTALGETFAGLGQWSRAETVLERAVDLYRDGPTSAGLADGVDALATVHQELGRLQEAESGFREALELRRRALGGGHPDTAMASNNLAVALWRLGELAEAESLLRDAWETVRRQLGEDGPAAQSTLGNLGLVVQADGRLAEAQPLLDRALGLAEALYGENHMTVATAANNLAVNHLRTGDLRSAEALARRSLTIRSTVLGKGHPTVGRAIHNLGLVLFAQERLQAAQQLFERALALRSRTLGDDHPETIESRDWLERVRRIAKALAAAPRTDRSG